MPNSTRVIGFPLGRKTIKWFPFKVWFALIGIAGSRIPVSRWKRITAAQFLFFFFENKLLQEQKQEADAKQISEAFLIFHETFNMHSDVTNTLWFVSDEDKSLCPWAYKLNCGLESWFIRKKTNYSVLKQQNWMSELQFLTNQKLFNITEIKAPPPHPHTF